MAISIASSTLRERKLWLNNAILVSRSSEPHALTSYPGTLLATESVDEGYFRSIF
ncbi:hypothetical protein [Chamaesiphon sp. VAR_69_metabat_338]|uniref:hypothetical protein n=1 Tax=Chamaesiphon sp. VAR_69_metabat_338 TaxID=2964704 RepID=UPI00286E00F2|nr:hypothetical protein [Chamaesiphon sp. VAR_69_metabat_338]